MARKRNGLRNLNYQSQAYWDKLLKQDGFSMEAGTSRRVTYVGTTATLESISDAQRSGTQGEWNKDVTHDSGEKGETS